MTDSPSRQTIGQVLLGLMAARRGHFFLESGHHGDLWLDVDRLFVEPARVRPFAEQLAARIAAFDVDALCGPLTGGAFLAQMAAERLGLPWVYAARSEANRASSDAGLFPVTYPIPAELHDYVRGRRVAVVNDVINAGSAVCGALNSLRDVGAQPVAILALLVLGDAAAALASSEHVALEAIAYEPNEIWTPDVCPHCAAGRPLDSPTFAIS
jgi:orotate phosphoribosyltransferase